MIPIAVLFAAVLLITGPSNKVRLASFLMMYTAFWLSEGIVAVRWS